jgi:flagellar protein FliO/FliZ
MTLEFLQTLAPLALVLALIAGAAWLLKRFNQPNRGKASLMTVQASLSVGPRERVVLLEVAGQWLVIGVTSGQINSLLNLPAQSLTDLEKLNTDKTSFAQSWLERYRQPTL